MLGCPLEGVAVDSVLDAGPALRATVDKYLGDPAFSNLPRKFKTSISGCARHCTNHEINDVAFVGVVGPDGEPGFDLWVGGGLSTNPRFAERLGVFVRPDEVSDVWAGVVSIFRDYGYRRQRNHARLKFLMADWGAEKFREVLERRVPAPRAARRPCPGRVAQPPRPHRRRGAVRRPGGHRRHHPLGRTSGTALRGLAELADRLRRRASGQVRLTAQQGVVVLDVAAQDVETVVDEMAELGYTVRPSAFRRGTIACTGIEFCKLALVETKSRAETIREEMERRLPEFDTPITINVNGCPNSCARFQVADIGFKGMVTRGDGRRAAEAFQVHLGGQMGTEAEFGRKFRGLKVTADEAPDYIERVLRGYLERREGGEPFATYVSRADEEWLL